MCDRATPACDDHYVFAWRRPYPDVFRVVTGLIAGAGTAFAIVVAAMLATHWRSGMALPAAGISGFIGVWLTLAWRLHRTAMVVGSAGIRVRWLLRTRTIPWPQIDEFDTAPDVLVRERLWIVLVDGRKVRTPIQRVSGAFGSALNDGGTWLRGSDYNNLLRFLRSEMQLRGAEPGK